MVKSIFTNFINYIILFCNYIVTKKMIYMNKFVFRQIQSIMTKHKLPHRNDNNIIHIVTTHT